MENPHFPVSKNILRSILVILWWVSVWGIAEIIVHHFSNAKTFGKIVFYCSLLLLVLGAVAIEPSLASHV